MHVLRKVYPGFFRFLLLCNDDSRFSFFYGRCTKPNNYPKEREGEGGRGTHRHPRTFHIDTHRHDVFLLYSSLCAFVDASSH